MRARHPIGKITRCQRAIQLPPEPTQHMSNIACNTPNSPIHLLIDAPPLSQLNYKTNNSFPSHHRLLSSRTPLLPFTFPHNFHPQARFLSFSPRFRRKLNSAPSSHPAFTANPSQMVSHILFVIPAKSLLFSALTASTCTKLLERNPSL